MKSASRLAVAVVLIYVAVISARPLNANDLFWHLAAGREILRTGEIPRSDPFSFTSTGAPWIDHEWLWQVAAQSLYAAASRGRGPTPDGAGALALILSGAAVVLTAFYLGLGRAARAGLPPAAIAGLGLLAAEAAKERLMVRPETASLLFLAILLSILGRGRAGPMRGLLLALVAALWSNIHPAVLIAPLVVLLYALGESLGPRTGAASGGGLSAVLLEPALAAGGTLVNPYGAGLLAVPFQLRGLVKNEAFFNPEWLAPPLVRFPLFYAAVIVLLAGALAFAVRTRRVPPGVILVAGVLAVLAGRQMRHMGLFAIAFLFAGAPLFRALDPRGTVASRLARRSASAVALTGAVLCALAVIAAGEGAISGARLDDGRFPVAACEEIAEKAPGLLLYNDVRFGSYLIWRFFPERRVFIDGRNELYRDLLVRLGGIFTGRAPYAEWRSLIGGFGIEGAIVHYSETKKGVIYPPARPGGPEVRGYRAWSAYLFPISEWALVYFDDTALVFMKRGGEGEAWIREAEYRELNLEDREYLLERAARDPAFAVRLRAEAKRRTHSAPPCERVQRFLEDLEPGPLAAGLTAPPG